MDKPKAKEWKAIDSNMDGGDKSRVWVLSGAIRAFDAEGRREG